MLKKIFPNLEEAIWSFAKNHKRYYLYPHSIKADEDVDSHYHRKANEWLCVTEGWFALYLENEMYIFKNPEFAKYLCLAIPKGKKHALWAITDLKYFIIRDRADRTVYKRKEKPNGRKKTR